MQPSHPTGRLFLSLSFGETSVYQYFEALTLALAPSSDSVHLFFDKKKVPPYSLGDNVHYHVWPSRRPNKIRDFLFLQRHIRSLRPDFLIGNFTAENLFGLLGWICKVPIRVTWFHTLTSQIDLDLGKLRLKHRFQRFRKKWILHRFTLIVCNSNASAKNLMGVFDYPQNGILQLPLLIRDPYPNFIWGTRSEKIIICVGRLDRSKGQEMLIKQIPRILERHFDCAFLFIGDGSEKLRLKSLVASMGLGNRVDFLGQLPKNKISELLLKSSISVSPSIKEAYGLVNVEALAAGTPVVGFATGGIPSIIETGKQGTLVPEGRDDLLGDAILELLENQEMRTRYGKGGRERFLNFFEVNNNCNSHAKMLLERTGYNYLGG